MTATSQQCIPTLRFKDEHGKGYPQWEEKFMRDICEINPSNGGLPNQFTYIDLDSVYKGMLVNENKVSKNSAPSRAQRILKENDVLFQTVRPYQQNNFFFNLTGDYVASTGYAQLRTKSSPLFLYHLLHEQKFVRKVLTRCTGTSYPAINSSDIGTIRIHLPDEKEQQKIATFLSAVDTKIEQLNRKKSLLEQYKKGMMQKLFSQGIRFKDEAGRDYPDWEEKNLNDAGKTFNGLTGKSSEHFGSGKHYIQYLQVFENSKIDIKHFGFVEINENESQNLVRCGDVFFTISSETPQDVGVTSVLLNEVEDTYLNSFCFGYRVDKTILSPEFARYAFRENGFRKKIIRLAQGSTRYNLSKHSLMKLKIRLPILLEQQKIADFLSAIDSKVELVAGQIEQARTFKQGLLQHMFI